MSSIDRYLKDIDQNLLLIKNTKGISQDVRKNINEMAVEVKRKLEKARNAVKKEVVQIVDGKFNMEESSGQEAERAERAYEKLMKEMRDIITNASRVVIREVEIQEIENVIYLKPDEKLTAKVKEYERQLTDLKKEIEELKDKIKKVDSLGSLGSGSRPLSEEKKSTRPPAVDEKKSTRPPPTHGVPMPTLAETFLNGIKPLFGDASRGTVPNVSLDAKIIEQISKGYSDLIESIANMEKDYIERLKFVNNRMNEQFKQITLFGGLVKDKIDKLGNTIFLQTNLIKELKKSQEDLLNLRDVPQSDDEHKYAFQQYVGLLETRNRTLTEDLNFMTEKRNEWLRRYADMGSEMDQLRAKLEETERLAETRRIALRSVSREAIFQEEMKNRGLAWVKQKEQDKIIENQKQLIDMCEQVNAKNEAIMNILVAINKFFKELIDVDSKISAQSEIILKIQELGQKTITAGVFKVAELLGSIREYELQSRENKFQFEKLKRESDEQKAKFDAAIKQKDTEYQNRLKHYEATFGHLSKNFDESENKRAKAEQELSELQKKLTEMKEANQSLMDKLDAMAKDSTVTTDKNIKERREEREAHNAQIKAITAETLKGYDELNEEFKHKLGAQIEQNKKLQAQIQQLRDQLDVLQSQQRKNGPASDQKGQGTGVPELFFARQPTVENKSIPRQESQMLINTNMDLAQKLAELQGIEKQNKLLQESLTAIKQAMENVQKNLDGCTEENKNLHDQLQRKEAEYNDLLDKYQHALTLLNNFATTKRGGSVTGGNPTSQFMVGTIRQIVAQLTEAKLPAEYETFKKQLVQFLQTIDNLTKSAIQHNELDTQIISAIEMNKFLLVQDLFKGFPVITNPNTSVKNMSDAIKYATNLYKNIEKLPVSDNDIFNKMKKHIILSYVGECVFVLNNLEKLGFTNFQNSVYKDLTQFLKFGSLRPVSGGSIKSGGDPTTTAVAVLGVTKQLSATVTITALFILTIIFLVYIIYTLKSEKVTKYIIRYYPENVDESCQTKSY